MWKNMLIKAAEDACSTLLPCLSPLRASARAELRDPRFQVLFTASLSRLDHPAATTCQHWGCTEDFSQEGTVGCWDLDFSAFLGLLDSTVCLPTLLCKLFQ